MESRYNNFNPNGIMQETEKLGNDWADKDAAYGALEDNKKTLLAALVSKKLDEGMPTSKAEYYALADKEYQTFLDNLSKARKAKNIALVKYNTYKKWTDLIQTQEANKRAEMKLGGLVT